MKKLIILFAVCLLTLAVVIGCGQKAEQESDKVPMEVKKADMADSTRMDSAMIDSTMDDMDEMGDEEDDADPYKNR